MSRTGRWCKDVTRRTRLRVISLDRAQFAPKLEARHLPFVGYVSGSHELTLVGKDGGRTIFFTLYVCLHAVSHFLVEPFELRKRLAMSENIMLTYVHQRRWLPMSEGDSVP